MALTDNASPFDQRLDLIMRLSRDTVFQAARDETKYAKDDSYVRLRSLLSTKNSIFYSVGPT